jgi:transcription elongation GreA/GreB family factor
LPGKNAEHFYTEYEIDCLAKLDLLIEDLTGAAHEAIEQAAAEAARATALASLERESAAIREAQRLQSENSRLKQGRVKTAVVTGVIGLFGGFAIGVGTTVILAGR